MSIQTLTASAILLFAREKKIKTGERFEQGKMYKKGTIFVMQSNSQLRLTVKYIHFATLYQETLWVIMRALTGVKRTYLSLRSKLQPQEANAYIPISEPGPYLSKDHRRMAAQPLYVSRQIAPSHLAKKLTSSLTSPPPTSLDEPCENMPLDLSEPQRAKSPDVTKNTELNHL